MIFPVGWISLHCKQDACHNRLPAPGKYIRFIMWGLGRRKSAETSISWGSRGAHRVNVSQRGIIYSVNMALKGARAPITAVSGPALSESAVPHSRKIRATLVAE